VREGEYQNASKNLLIGRFLLEEVEPAPKGDIRIKVVIELD